MSTVRITTSQNIELDYELASLGERLLAWLLDGLIIFAYVLLLSFLVFSSMTSRDGETLFLLLMLPVLLYSLLSETLLNGQSVGKKILKIKVISLDGGSASFSQYLLRWVFRLVDISFTSGLGAVISIAVTERAQRIGDLVAGTTLVRTTPRTSIQETLYVPQPTEVQEYRVKYPEVVNLTDADMQLIKEVILNVRRSGNTTLALQATEKVEEKLQISRGYDDPTLFLTTLLSDYNFLTSQNG